MCQLLNVFVPVKRAVLALPVRGLSLAPGGEVQRDFAERYVGERGTMLSGWSANGCMCGFSDWEALFTIATELLDRNNAPYVAALLFWSGDSYTLTSREADPEDEAQRAPLREREVLVLRGAPAEQRRHRRVVRTLAGAVGAAVVLKLKGGRSLAGTLHAFDAESELGTIDAQVFVAAQILEVEKR